jgi:hypothetical protein
VAETETKIAQQHSIITFPQPIQFIVTHINSSKDKSGALIEID